MVVFPSSSQKVVFLVLLTGSCIDMSQVASVLSVVNMIYGS